MSQASAEKVRIVCDSCGARFKAPASKAGKKGKCPKCGAIFTVPALEPVAAATAGADVDWSMLSDAVASARQTTSRSAGGGYDVAETDDPALAAAVITPPTPPPAAAKKGAKGTGAKPPPPGAKLRGKGAAIAQGARPERLLLGIILALLFGALASAIWLTLTIFLRGIATGYLAIGVGIAVGAGMYFGYGKRSVLAGGIASLIAIAAIFAGIAVPAAIISAGWEAIASPGARFEPFSAEKARTELARVYSHDILADRGLKMISATELERYQAKAMAEEHVSSLKSVELQLQWRRYQIRLYRESMELGGKSGDELELGQERIRNEVAKMSDEDCSAYMNALKQTAPPTAPSFGAVLAELFSWWQVLWMVLALGAAYTISGF